MMQTIMKFIRNNLLYRNIPDIQTGNKIHEIKNQMTEESLKTHLKIKKFNVMVDKTPTFYIGKAMGVIK